MKPSQLKPLITHAPQSLARKIDAAAKRANRSRSAEIQRRLEESFARETVAKQQPVVAA
jgi:predicted transcriptional regulator